MREAADSLFLALAVLVAAARSHGRVAQIYAARHDSPQNFTKFGHGRDTATPSQPQIPDHWLRLGRERHLQPKYAEDRKLLQELREKFLEVRVAAARDNVQVYVENKMELLIPNITSAGTHVLVLARPDGRVMLRRGFRTGQPSEGKLLAECLGNLQPGRLVLLVMVGDAGRHLRATERALLRLLGVGSGLVAAMSSKPAEPHDTSLSWARRGEQRADVGRLGKRRRRGWKDSHSDSPAQSYVDTQDPSVLLSIVPEGWPPQGPQDLLEPKVFLETAIVFEGLKTQPSNIAVSSYVPRTAERRCAWHADVRRTRQAQFCGRYDGYGTLCRCDDPLDPQLLRRAAPRMWMAEVIPVAMLTATKTYFFFRQLMNLLLADGAAQTPILVLTDGHQEETRHLAELFGLPVVEHQSEGRAGTSAPLNAHFRFSLYTAFSTFANASKVIILEDDLIVSPDFIRYFHQTAWLLEEDPSLYVVNSFSQNSCVTVAEDASRVRRSESLPQFGWMVTRKYAQEVIQRWVASSEESIDWDWWLHMEAVRRGRHAVVPEVSRSLHSGSSGAHVSGWAQAFIFSNMIYNRDPHARLAGLHLLPQAVYDKRLIEELQRAVQLPSDVDLCHLERLEAIPPDMRVATLLLGVYADTANDEALTLQTVMQCLHIFDSHDADHYKGVLEFTLTTILPHVRLLVLACPMSPFCSEVKNLTLRSTAPEMLEAVEEQDNVWRYTRWLQHTQEVRYFDHHATYLSPTETMTGKKASFNRATEFR